LSKDKNICGVDFSTIFINSHVCKKKISAKEIESKAFETFYKTKEKKKRREKVRTKKNKKSTQH
jgi:hypothetical protein